jgi:hypothetical protein
MQNCKKSHKIYSHCVCPSFVARLHMCQAAICADASSLKFTNLITLTYAATRHFFMFGRCLLSCAIRVVSSLSV